MCIALCSFGRSKQEAEDFVNAFDDVFVTRRLRIMGDDVRLFRCYPGDWQVHFIWANGRGALLAGVDKARPGYERLLSLLQSVPGSKASRSWVDRVNPFSRLGGSGVSFEDLLAAREAANNRNSTRSGARSSWQAADSPGARSAGGPSARRADQQWHDTADRFGEIDIITGRRVRDLKLDPVLQLADWQRSLFGSKESSIMESLDEESQS